MYVCTTYVHLCMYVCMYVCMYSKKKMYVCMYTSIVCVCCIYYRHACRTLIPYIFTFLRQHKSIKDLHKLTEVLEEIPQGLLLEVAKNIQNMFQST